MPSSYTLGPHYEQFVRNMVRSGRYASASEVMRDGLRLMEEREELRAAKLEALRASIQEGLDSGPAEALDIEEIKRASRHLRRRAKSADLDE